MFPPLLCCLDEGGKGGKGALGRASGASREGHLPFSVLPGMGHTSCAPAPTATSGESRPALHTRVSKTGRFLMNPLKVFTAATFPVVMRVDNGPPRPETASARPDPRAHSRGVRPDVSLHAVGGETFRYRRAGSSVHNGPLCPAQRTRGICIFEASWLRGGRHYLQPGAPHVWATPCGRAGVCVLGTGPA